MTEDFINPDAVEPEPTESETELPSPFESAEPPPLPSEVRAAAEEAGDVDTPPSLPAGDSEAEATEPPPLPEVAPETEPGDVVPDQETVILPPLPEEPAPSMLTVERSGPIEFEPTPVQSAGPVPSAAAEAAPPKKNNQTLIIVIIVVAVLLLLCCCCVIIVGVSSVPWQDFQYNLLRPLLSLLRA